MRKISEKCRRAFSAILAAAMVLTSAPGTTMPVLAAEQTAVVTEVSDADEMTAEDTADDEKASNGEDAPDEEDTSDGKDASKGEDSSDGEDAPKGEDASDDEDSSDGEDAPKGEDASDDEDSSDGEDAPKGEDASDDEDSSDGENAPKGEDASDDEDSSDGEDASKGENASDIEEDKSADDAEAFTGVSNLTITLKDGDTPLESGAEVAYGTVVTAEIAAENHPTVYYTLDGTEPTEDSETYTEAISLSSENTAGETITLCAKGKYTENMWTNVAEASITFLAQGLPKTPLPTPVIEKNPADGQAGNRTNASFTLSISDNSIPENTVLCYYISEEEIAEGQLSQTLESGTQYTGEVTVNAPDTDAEAKRYVYAMAAPEGESSSYLASEVSSAEFTFAAVQSTPEQSAELTVEGNTDAVRITVTDAQDSEKTYSLLGNTITVPKDAGLKVVIKEKKDCTLKAATLDDVNQQVKKGEAQFSLTADKNHKITVDAEEKISGHTVRQYDAGDWWNELTPVKGKSTTYDVPARADLSIAAVMGASDKEVVFEKAEIYENQEKLTADSASAALYNGGKEVRVTTGKELAGHTVTVRAYAGAYADGSGYAQELALTFRITSVATSVKVSEAKNNTLTQEMDSLQRYAITRTPSTSKDEIGVMLVGENEDITNSCVVYVENGKLCVNAGRKKGRDRIILYNKTALTARGGETSELTNEEKLAEYTFETTAPAWNGQAPSVKLESATDTELYLKITAPKKLSAEAAGHYGYYYEVSCKEKNTEGNPKKAYVSCDSEVKKIKVIDAEPGAGDAKNFEVSVKLICVNDDVTPTSENPAAEGDLWAQSRESGKISCSTRKPCYADKITLKKKTTTVYTGQSGVEAAVINFGKTATYVEGADAEVQQSGYGRDYVTAVVEGNKVIVSADSHAPAGKYTVRVTAPAPDGTKAAAAELTIQVVNSVQNFGLEASTETIYVGNGKAGSASVRPVYYYTEYKPKKEKYVYQVGRMSGEHFTEDPSVLTYKDSKGNVKNAVSVKNGKITVDKNYQVSDKEGANTFVICVKANDYPGNTAYALAYFTVTNEPQKMGKLVIIDSYGKEILGEDNAVVTIADLMEDGSRGIYCNVLDKDAEPDPKTGRYSGEDLMNERSCSWTIKGKGLTCDKYGKLHVNGPGKNIKITATATDGSGKTVSLTIKEITYQTMKEGEDIVVRWSDGDEKSGVLKESRDYSVTVPTGTLLELGEFIVGEDPENYTSVDKSWNYSIAVSGDVKQVCDRQTNYPWLLAKNQAQQFILTGDKVTIKLKEGNQIIRTYSLHTKPEKEELPAPTISAPSGKLVAGSYLDQVLTFRIKSGKDKIPANAKVEMTALDEKNGRWYHYEEGGGYEYTEVAYDSDRGEVVFTAKGQVNLGSGTMYFRFKDPVTGQSTALTNGVKVTSTAMKKSFKLTNKYKMSAVDAAEVPLEYKGSNVCNLVANAEIKNINTKGSINHITDVLEICEDKTCLKLKDGVDYADLAGKTLEGYICGSMYYADMEEQKYETKVSITFANENKSVNTYKADNVVIQGKIRDTDLAEVPVTVKTGKQEAEIVSAADVSIKKGSKYEPTTLYTASVEDGKLLLDLTDGCKGWKGEKDLTVNLQIQVAYKNNYTKNSKPTYTTLNVKAIIKKGTEITMTLK